MTLWKRIQKHLGLHPDGVAGPKTAQAVADAIDLPPEKVIGNESGLSHLTTRNINLIAIHCSATREGVNVKTETLRQWHLDRGWSDIGYHYVIELDGTVMRGRPLDKIGSHIKGHNTGSIGVCYIGGLDAQGKGKDTRTDAQKASMKVLVGELLKSHPQAILRGHRDMSPDLDGDGVIERHEWMKECPCFDVQEWWDQVR